MLGRTDWGSVVLHPSSSRDDSSIHLRPWFWNAKEVFELPKADYTRQQTYNYSPSDGGEGLYKRGILYKGRWADLRWQCLFVDSTLLTFHGQWLILEDALCVWLLLSRRSRTLCSVAWTCIHWLDNRRPGWTSLPSLYMHIKGKKKNKKLSSDVICTTICSKNISGKILILTNSCIKANNSNVVVHVMIVGFT